MMMMMLTVNKQSEYLIMLVYNRYTSSDCGRSVAMTTGNTNTHTHTLLVKVLPEL